MSVRIAHVQYIEILTRLQGFKVKIANSSLLHCLAIPIGDLSTKKTKPNIEKMTRKLQSHVRILIYRTWAIISDEFWFLGNCPP